MVLSHQNRGRGVFECGFWLNTPGWESQHFRSKPAPLQQAMYTIHELQFAREFKTAVRHAFPQLFLALLAQMHYILELDQPTEPEQEQKAQEAAMPSPQR